MIVTQYKKTMIVLYFLCLIFFLTPICILITKQLFTIINSYIVGLQFQNNTIKDKNNEFNTLNIACTYIERKLWITCIKLLEKSLNDSHKSNVEYYNLLGLCYSRMAIYKIAHHHYSKALKKEPKNLTSLLSMGRIYTLTAKDNEAIKIYSQILDIDDNNQIAKQAIKILQRG